ncbi:MAG: bifunctional 23S rRNA (guanine(2069)-N(7))-methyltransferase RlmK/23S rRNA (guanine(2445)-N(2))-methyltransferase RlmL [Spirochaetes bacterium]|nr:bifunctional 23S rRNA (guanine(2069)-N(7))-methyltransferase RlmK/23S rRNA (guanine(2445)-N(2))-methyltransferase RlmL [Spirochaetota bacterium]
MNNNHNELFASTAGGIEPILAEELRGLGAGNVRVTAGGVSFTGGDDVAMRSCLWCRTASRIFISLGRYDVATPDDVYGAVKSISWEERCPAGRTVAVDFDGTGAGIANTMYGAQLVKDAVVDRVRERLGRRPAVDAERPDILINCRLARGGFEVRVDLSGGGLHRRGYRLEAGAAPLRENLAAALLLKVGWPGIAAGGGSFIDPMCGSGTLVVEAALIACDAAPGLRRPRWGFAGWPGFDAAAWKEMLAEAEERLAAGLRRAPACYGFDSDAGVVKVAHQNAKRAGIGQAARFERRLLADASPPEGAPAGLVLTNPPYGKRMGDAKDLGPLYAALGDALKDRFAGWRAAVFTGEPELGKRMGLRAHRTNVFYNGPIECRLLQFRVEPERFVDRDALDARREKQGLERAMARGADAFANRVRKNMRTIGRWAARENIECYRIYDADLPEYAAAVDIYAGRIHVQEYAAPSSIDPGRAAERLEDILAVLPHALGMNRDGMVLKIRRRQKGKQQYDKHSDRGEFFEVREGACRLLVNLTDYLDTGLFLDHRTTREMIGRMAEGKRFLNLFCYTAAATAHAALGGAIATDSVDLSAAYLDWAKRNLSLNGITGPRHRLVRADCISWIRSCRERYDLIFLDPPTFSNSKSMKETFDVQRDHPGLIGETARLLAPGGVLIFSTNKNKFRLDAGSLAGFHFEDITARTIPRDFGRNPRIHSCWMITRTEAAGRKRR